MKRSKKTLVKCECGCGEYFYRSPCEIHRTNHHFYNLGHYAKWRKNKKPNGKPATEKHKSVNGQALAFRVTPEKAGLAVGRTFTRYCEVVK